MRIGVDIRPLIDPHPSGVGEYADQLISAMLSRGREHEFVLYANAYHLTREEITSRFRGANVSYRLTRIPNKLLHASISALRVPTLDAFTGPVDCFFLPNWNFAAFSKRTKRVVLTVHDVTYLRYPQYYSTRRRLWHRVIRARRLIRQADAVISVSAHTGEEIHELFGVPTSRIHTVRSGLARSFLERPSTDDQRRVRGRYALPERYGLLLATIEPRKNLEGALLAYDAYIRTTGDDIDLVVVGARGWSVKSLERLHERLATRSRIHFIGYVPSADRAPIYVQSAFFLFPSFAEGFGFPPLEAASQGVPVIASATSALPEIIGDIALLVDPHDVGQISEAIREVVRDEQLREQLARAGQQHVRSFSWDRTADETLAVLTGGRA